MSFNGFMKMRMHKPHLESKFQSFQKFKGQNIIAMFMGVLSELLVSILRSLCLDRKE